LFFRSSKMHPQASCGCPDDVQPETKSLRTLSERPFEPLEPPQPARTTTAASAAAVVAAFSWMMVSPCRVAD
jgi:hypothetical protein